MEMRKLIVGIILLLLSVFAFQAEESFAANYITSLTADLYQIKEGPATGEIVLGVKMVGRGSIVSAQVNYGYVTDGYYTSEGNSLTGVTYYYRTNKQESWFISGYAPGNLPNYLCQIEVLATHNVTPPQNAGVPDPWQITMQPVNWGANSPTKEKLPEAPKTYDTRFQS